ncbi:SRPBCC domain-containing protein [Pontibacter sp. KCTC 32443]|uniref:SRPBCC family protein n=1 Tax=Pontibacter TaxID=323449 RepID=UPI00164D067F|nr:MULTISPECIES: SRPBCC domain-containing protein [Pontibacter]MBC5773274.1 SRPBCC domain-containing protein [Pontibacter sp. KCTC 32443]
MRKVEATISIKTSPASVIAAFIDEKLLCGWWGVERSLIERKVGGLYVLTWNITKEGFGYISSGTIRTYQPDALLIVENLVYLNPVKPILGPMVLTVSATQENNSTTTLYLCQEGYQQSPGWDWYYEAVSQAWPVVLETLKKYLEQAVN